MPETSVTEVSAQTSRKLVRIEITATSSGTNAISDAKTNASTSSAPSPPRSDSARSPAPPFSPVEAASAFSPVRCTGAPATVAP